MKTSIKKNIKKTLQKIAKNTSKSEGFCTNTPDCGALSEYDATMREAWWEPSGQPALFFS